MSYANDPQKEADFDEDDEMPATERELAEDAQWKKIQKNTFTRWANEHLKTVEKKINDLEHDLSDGLRLIALVEVLSGKQFKSKNKRPNFRTQKLENVTLTLKFLEDDEQIKIVNIDSSDIVDGKLKLILGLIWTLILHYSISMPMWDDEDEVPDASREKEGPKARLLRWLNTKVPDKPITNFNTDWQDGTAIGALVDAVAPGLCPDWEDWEPKNKKQNAKEAMDLAEKWLDIPQLIKPEEMTSKDVDDPSMMTYLAQFPNAKLKPGAPLRPRTNAGRVRAYGPGLESTGNNCGAHCKFTVETFGAGRGDVSVTVLNPDDIEESCNVKFNNDRNLTYSCDYTPTMEGEYRVIIKFAGKEIPKSPYRVVVEGAVGDASKVRAEGPGLQRKGVQVTKKTYFEVFAKDAGNGVLEVVIMDPHGHKDSVKPKITDRGDGTYLVEYVPKDLGQHSVHVSFAGKAIPNSPYGVNVSPPVDPKRCYATGRGVQPKGIRVGDVADFKVHTEGAGQGELAVQILAPGGVEEKVDVKKVNEDTYACVYKPQKPGHYVINVTYSGQHIAKSPFKVDIGPFKESRIRAYGPGLEGGMCGKPADFVVETNGETGALGFQVEGPSQAKIDCNDNGDGSADVSYMPSAPGEYAVHILCNEEDIPNSPFMAQIQPATTEYNPSMVVAKGPGLEKTGVETGKWAMFTVDATKAGRAPLNITAIDADYNPVEVQVHDNKNGTYSCRYLPKQNVKHTVFISYGGCNVPNSPFRVYVQEPSKPDNVKVFGPGVEKGVKTFEPTKFFVDCKKAGPGDVAIAMTDERGIDVPLETTMVEEGLFQIAYEPKSVGDYSLAVFFAEKEIPSSPMKVSVEPSIDVSKVIVDGLEERVFMESSTDFTVDCRSVTPQSPDDKVRAIITNPSGTKNDTFVTNNGDGTFKVDYTPYEQGPHEIDVSYEGIPIPNSPFPVEVVPGNDPTRVQAYGPGLENGVTNVPQTFTISTRGAGKGGLGLAMEGPSEAQMTCKDNKDGTCTVEYLPTKAGPYKMNVSFADQPIPGSPFTIPIRDEIRPDKCVAYGPGLDDKGVRAGQPATFTVDCREAGEAPLEATFTDELGNPQPCDVEPVDENVYNVTYYPAAEGVCQLGVTYNGENIPNSPIQQPILPTADASQVKVTGPGVHSGVPASLPVSFTIDTTDAGVGDLDVSIVAPDGSAVRPKVTDNGDGTFTITYVPEDIGRYTIVVKFADQIVPGAPFNVESVPTGDASKCQLTESLPKTVCVGEEVVITVDAATAGTGNITCRIRTPTDTDADIDILDNGDGTFTIKYTPSVAGPYTINIKFGGEPIPQGTCVQQAVNPEEFEEQILADSSDLIQAEVTDRLDSAPWSEDFSSVEFSLPVGPVFNFVDAEVTMPSGKKSYPKIEDNKDGTVTVKYQPTEMGLHELAVKYNNEPIEGSPFKFFVDSIKSGYVTAYGPGLSFGVSGEPANFTVVTKDAGAGGLALAVEGPSKCEILCQDNQDGTCSITYLPMAPGEYKVVVKYNDQHIAGSPFFPKIVGGGRRRTSFNRGSEFSLKVSETDISDLTATIKAPSGKEEPCILKKLANGHLGISFTPHETGEHLVNVYRSGQHIANSPFKIHVSRNEIGNASKVKVYGKGLEEGTANQRNEFTVDTKEAGYGGLSLSIEGPSKADIECNDNEDGTCLVSYKPTEPGTYIINIKFADEHVPGSPFTVKIGGVSAGHVVEKISRQQECVDVTHAGSHCELSLKIPGSDALDMTASVTNPSGVTELCEIMDLDDCHYSIRFTPVEMGVHTVMVKYKDMHIPGSPFQFTVGPITEGGAHKVHAAGPGVERGEVDVPNEFNIYTREAGAGSLSIGVEGPSKAEIKFEDRKDGSCGVQYTCTEPGEYIVNVKFNDEHVPDSPFHVPIVPSTGDARKVTVQSLQQKGLQVGKPASFSCVFNGASGHLSAKIVSPSGAEDTAIIQPIDESNGHYAVRFIPRENGVHYVHVYLDGNHIKGSPFRMLVGKIDADPGLVHARGKGLTKGETNQHNKFIVSTVGAGASTLGVTIDGPSKVELNCKEIPEGYEFDYVPTAPGSYLITIKYASNTHIVGSPFKATITGEGSGSGLVEQTQCIVDTVSKTEAGLGFQMPKLQSDASKVTARGNGLQKSFVNKKTTFTVDTKDAGQNMLFVGVIGPAKSAPCDEVNIKHTRATEYTISYVVKDKGQYMLVVKWGDDHIPGSPFQVNVL